ncbi:MAG: hypothetical protein A3G93_06500 [Nitrospinae bacterium RIFCSPLOWO2_12_FULL_45_22]|nr:MAG: hypothetical protein A3G93_06500 [Nitrospinae bacterium RIFCSPLOWO2_12_FULL_45_22]
MRVTVWVRPNARNEKVEKVSDGEYRVWVKAPAREGKANQALIEVLADYFDRPRQAIILYKGASSRKKFVEIL